MYIYVALQRHGYLHKRKGFVAAVLFDFDNQITNCLSIDGQFYFN